MSDMPPLRTESIPPVQQMAPRRRPFKPWYLSFVGGVALWIATMAITIPFLVRSVGNLFGQRAPMPGQATFQLQAGEYEINYDEISTIDGRIVQSPAFKSRDDLAIRLVRADTEKELALTPKYDRNTYSRDHESSSGQSRYAGITLYTVTVPEPGDYVLHGTPLPGEDSYVLAMEANFGGPLVGLSLLLGLATLIGWLSLIGLLVTAIVHAISGTVSRKRCDINERI